MHSNPQNYVSLSRELVEGLQQMNAKNIFPESLDPAILEKPVVQFDDVIGQDDIKRFDKGGNNGNGNKKKNNNGNRPQRSEGNNNPNQNRPNNPNQNKPNNPNQNRPNNPNQNNTNQNRPNNPNQNREGTQPPSSKPILIKNKGGNQNKDLGNDTAPKPEGN
jgi:hypothetical protein